MSADCFPNLDHMERMRRKLAEEHERLPVPTLNDSAAADVAVEAERMHEE